MATEMISRMILALVLTVVIALVSSSCDSASCTASGFSPGEQVQVSYRNSGGQTVDLVGYADANGEIRIEGCTEILAQFGD